MRKPVTRPAKPPRRSRLMRPTLAENIAIMRGIAADPDTRELSRKEMRRLRPFHEAMTLDRIAHAPRGVRAAAYLIGEHRMRLYLDAAHEAASALKMPGIVDAANTTIERARARIASNGKRPR